MTIQRSFSLGNTIKSPTMKSIAGRLGVWHYIG